MQCIWDFSGPGLRAWRVPGVANWPAPHRAEHSAATCKPVSSSNGPCMFEPVVGLLVLDELMGDGRWATRSVVHGVAPLPDPSFLKRWRTLTGRVRWSALPLCPLHFSRVRSRGGGTNCGPSASLWACEHGSLGRPTERVFPCPCYERRWRTLRIARVTENAGVRRCQQVNAEQGSTPAEPQAP